MLACEKLLELFKLTTPVGCPLLCVGCRSCLHYAAGAGHTRCINMLLNQFVTVLQPVAQAAAEQQPQLQRQQQQLVLLSEAVVQDSYRGTTR